MTKILPASLALALCAPIVAMADTPADIAALRQELDALRAAYEARLQALEQRLKAAEAAPPATAPVATTPPPSAPPAASATASSGGAANAFNPAMSLILSGLYTRTSKDPATYTISGFQLPGDAEIGPELGRGRSSPGSDSPRNGAGMTALPAHTGGDIGDSHSWRAGLSVLSAKADDQALVATDATGHAVTNAFNGRTRVWVADAIWKWAPNGNATRTSFKLQGEYLRSTRSGSLTYDVGRTDSAADYRAVQSGWYLQGVYQFMPRWRVGLRTERLDPGTPDYGLNAPFFADSGYHPSKNTLMVDFSPSEFSRLRLQLARDRARENVTD